MLPQMANRHGLITGATGTGKTVTLQTLAEAFSRIGVPVFLSDIKGDLSGISKAGGGNAKVAARVEQLKLEDFTHRAYPVTFWDVFGAMGHPLRATVSDMGPLLLRAHAEPQRGAARRTDAGVQDRRRQTACCCST